MKLTQFVREKQRVIHLMMLLIAVSFFVLMASGVPLPPELASTVGFSVVAYILFDISQNTYSYSRNRLYRQDMDLIPDLLRLLDGKGVKEAQLIQYSGKMVNIILRKLIAKGGAVTLWLQDPTLAVGDEQRSRINLSVDGLPSELEAAGQPSLKVCHYQAPASTRGILIDRKILIIGFYTYEHVFKHSQKYPNDKFEISGHDRPCWLLYEGTPEFSIMRDMFEEQLANFRENHKNRDCPPALQWPEEASGGLQMSPNGEIAGEAPAVPRG
jgi:hypothetical protein